MPVQYSDLIGSGTTPVLATVQNYAALDSISELNLMNGARCTVKDTGITYVFKNSVGWVIAEGAQFILSGSVTWSGGTAMLDVAAASVLATDRVIATVSQKGAQNIYSCTADAAAGSIHFELPQPNTSNDVQISYNVYRDLALV